MLIFQGPLVKSYPAELRLTVFQCLCSAIQTAVIAVIFERSPSSWKLKLNIPLLAAVYCVSSLPSYNHIYIGTVMHGWWSNGKAGNGHWHKLLADHLVCGSEGPCFHISLHSNGTPCHCYLFHHCLEGDASLGKVKLTLLSAKVKLNIEINYINQK